MDKSKIYKVEDVNGFDFQFWIEKAEIDQEPEDSFSITGVASTANVDHDSERMAEPALERMVNIINEKSVPLRIEHQKSDNAIIGKVNRAWIDERKKVWIKADLDRNNPAAVMLKNALKSGAKLGLSVGGRVKRAMTELAEGAGKMIKTFYDVILDEVSVTPRPSNYDSWLLNKHYIEEGEDSSRYYETKIYDRFLFENPKFDYLMAIEKSIPNDLWKKVEPDNNVNNDMEIKKVDSTETKENEKEEVASKSYVDGKFNEITTLLNKAIETINKGMKVTVDATDINRETTPGITGVEAPVDQTLPTDTKPENPAQEREVKSVKKEGANGGGADATREATGTEVPVATESSTLDESNPAGIKTENPAQEREIKSALKKFIDSVSKIVSKDAEDMPKEEIDSTKKEEVVSESSKPSSDKKDETEKADVDDKKEDTEIETTKDEDSSSGSSKKEDYNLEQFNRSMKDKGITSIDMFAAYVSKAIQDLRDGLQKSGKRVVGLEQVIADLIRNDAVIQKSIKSWLNEPGAKKSVVMGSPYVFMKNGSRLKLINEDSFVQKSVDPKLKFGDVYKANFSSENDK